MKQTNEKWDKKGYNTEGIETFVKLDLVFYTFNIYRKTAFLRLDIQIPTICSNKNKLPLNERMSWSVTLIHTCP